MPEQPSANGVPRAFVVPCATLDAGAPWRWLRAGWQDTPELGLNLKLDNLLDKDYAEATYSTPNGRFGYNNAGRTALFAVTWTPQL